MRFTEPSRGGGSGNIDFSKSSGEPVRRLGNQLVRFAGPFGEVTDIIAEHLGLLDGFATERADLLSQRARCLFGARQILE